MAERLYQVKNGESLKSIALAQLNDTLRWQELAHINSMSHPYTVTPGTLILVPDPYDKPMTLLITSGTPARTNDSPADDPGITSLSPAQWAGIAAGAGFLWWYLK